MNDNITHNTSFNDLYTKSYRLAAAVFTVSNIINEKEELRTKIKNLALELVSMSVNLKDINFSDARKQLINIEKNSLELMSLLDIASLSGLISEMNAKILKEEFQSFISEITQFAQKFEDTKNVSVRNIFEYSASSLDNKFENTEKFNLLPSQTGVYKKQENLESREVGRDEKIEKNNKENNKENNRQNGNGHKRKDLRKNTIFEFIKRHNNVSIKDIAPHIIGCSEKTVQRELIELISEGKVAKVGERRWSKYSII